MKNKEIKKLSIDELKNKVNSLKKDLFNFRFRKVNGQLESTAKVSQIKKDVAKNFNSVKPQKIDMSKKILNGQVIRDQNNKTIVVLVKRKYSHPFFGKVITSSKKYHAHDEKNKFKIGDNVKIIESKPFSKKKKWEVINK